MNILVLGKGLAAMGFLEALMTKGAPVKGGCHVQWIGPDLEDKGWGNCSRNSTAVVALHGIKRGVSPLGDDLVEAYEKALKFFKENTPSGVQKLTRFHLVKGDSEKLVQRFGLIENLSVLGKELSGVQEEALVYEPEVFLSWWKERLVQGFHDLQDQSLTLSVIDDVVTQISHDGMIHLQGMSDNYEGDRLIDCRGSGVNELASVSLKVKRIPGHYWVWQNQELKTVLGEEGFVLTLNGHNLIYKADAAKVILGGSTEEEGMSAFSFLELEEQRKDFLKLFPQLEEVLTPSDALVFTGKRTKGPKRRPILERNSGTIVINGLYKNGYSLCYSFGEKALQNLV